MMTVPHAARLRAKVIWATVPIDVGPPLRITLRASLNTYAPDRRRAPPESKRQLQQPPKSGLGFASKPCGSASPDMMRYSTGHYGKRINIDKKKKSRG